MGLKITLAGVDITDFVQEETIQIQDTLGQTAGNQGGNSGRAKTCVLYCFLGPAGTAVGAGTTVHTPQLVRMGEVIIWDASNNLIFGGYATKMVDHTDKTTNIVEIDCADYWQYLDRIMVDVTYDGNTDIYMINNLLSTYAPWISRVELPSTAAFTFGPKVYRHISLQKALQDICDTTGYMMWVTPDKHAHYVLPTNAANAPFALSDTPDFRTSYSHNVTDYEIDDNSAINRVTFYGGKKLSNNYTQNVSNQADGTNVTFLLPYYPHPTTDGKVHVFENGVNLVVGTATGTTTNLNNVLKSQGGNADVLLNASGNSLQFAYAPAAGALVQVEYRYEFPLVVTISEQASISYYGQVLEGVLIDSTVLDSNTAAQQCRILLLEQSFGLVTLQVTCWQPGIVSGMLLKITNTIRGINGVYVVQEVDVVPKGAGFFEYDLTLGAWNWNLVDVMMTLSQNTQPQDSSLTEDITDLTVVQITDNVNATDSVAVTKVQTLGLFYARATAVGDGHDAYPGFFSVSGYYDNDTFQGRNVSGGWGTASDGNAWTVAGGSATGLSVSSSTEKGVDTYNTGTQQKIMLGSSEDDMDVTVRWIPSDAACEAGLFLRWGSASNYYLAYFSGGGVFQLFKEVSGTGTTMTSTSFTPTAGQAYWIRAQANDTTLNAKIWADGTAEPNWMITTTDSNLTSGNYGVYSKPDTTAATNQFDSFYAAAGD